MADQSKSFFSSYASVPGTPEEMSERVQYERQDSRPKIELGDHSPMMKPRKWLSTVFWQTFALLWLAPVLLLMYWNFTELVIGASAWCPGGDCLLNTFNPVSAVPAARAQHYDKESHNLIGGLQFVAKGLEIWFGVIAAALMYLVTMKAAGKREGLPIGYLTRPMEFADPITLVDPLLWKTGPSPFTARKESEKRVGRRVWYLIALSIFLCALINLMGPATAVLVIPALQWITTPEVGSEKFGSMLSADAPSTTAPTGMWWTLQTNGLCSEEEFLAHNYTCTQKVLGNSMDSWLSSMIAADGANTGRTNHQGLTFAANMTFHSNTTNSLIVESAINEQKPILSKEIYWVPSRQVISRVALDYRVVQDISTGFTVSDLEALHKLGSDPIESYVEYNKSLQLTMQRDGPITGLISNMYFDFNNSGHSIVQVDADRQVRCFVNYMLGNSPLTAGAMDGTYTKCIRTGSGWSSQNKAVGFFTEKVYNENTHTLDAGVDVTVWSSDKAAFFPNNNIPAWLPKPCITGGTLLNSTICPWERMFAAPDPDSPIANRTENITTVDFYMYDGITQAHLFVDFIAFPVFTTYTIDANPVSNPLNFIKNGDLPAQGGNSVPIDPNWYLAAWSTVDTGTLLSNRTSTALLQSVMQTLIANSVTDYIDGDNYLNQAYISLLPVLQTLSLLDFSTTPTTSLKTTDQAHPVLLRKAQMYVWSYGLTSRTSYLGMAVAIAGCCVVLTQFVLGFTDRRRYRAPTQLLVAALEHSPRGEFVGKEHDEVAMARVRFHIRDNEHQTGKFSFFEPEEKETHGLAQQI